MGVCQSREESSVACVWKSVGNAWAYVVYDTERLKPYLVSQLFQNLKDLAGDFDDGVNGTALIIHDRKGTEEALTLHLHRTATARRRLLVESAENNRAREDKGERV